MRSTLAKPAVVAVAMLGAVATPARADALEDIVTARIAPQLPPTLGVAKVHVPPALARLDLDPAAITVEPPRRARPGRASYRVTLRGRSAIYVPVTVGKLVEVAIARRDLRAGRVITRDDLIVERRAIDLVLPAAPATLTGATVVADILAGSPVAARDVAPVAPVPRGTQIAVEIRRGGVFIHGTGTLELAARPGEPATARLAHTHAVVRGTLRSPTTLVVGELP